jgi:hypothetical protein
MPCSHLAQPTRARWQSRQWGAERPVQGLVTPEIYNLPFGDQPVEILREIRRACESNGLRELNLRARSLACDLDNPASPDWLTGFTSLVDASVVRRIIAMASPESRKPAGACGSSGRASRSPNWRRKLS